MKDFLYNHYLSVKNFFIKLLNIKKKVKNNYSICNHIFNFESMTVEELYAHYKFRPDWGLYHPKKAFEWYDSSAVKLTTKGLELGITDNIHKDGTNYIMTGVGMCISQHHYPYGKFEWNITLPKGVQLWPAVWLTDSVTWPPEIDVLEAYSDDKMNYGKRLNTNLFIGKSSDPFQIGAMKHGLLINKSDKLNLKLDWTENYINIYYNNLLVRSVTDEETLSHFKGRKMKVIMNNATRKPRVLFDDIKVTPFIVHNFTYTKNK